MCIHGIHMGIVAEKLSEVVTFRLPASVCERLDEQAKEGPRLEGMPAPSRNDLARSMVMQGLDGRERRTKEAIVERIKSLKDIVAEYPGTPSAQPMFMLDLCIEIINNENYLDPYIDTKSIDGLLGVDLTEKGETT